MNFMTKTIGRQWNVSCGTGKIKIFRVVTLLKIYIMEYRFPSGIIINSFSVNWIGSSAKKKHTHTACPMKCVCVCNNK